MLCLIGLGMGELIIILIIVLLVFGVGRLGPLGDALGRSIKNFKRAVKGDDEIDVTPKRDKEIEESAASSRDNVKKG